MFMAIAASDMKATTAGKKIRLIATIGIMLDFDLGLGRRKYIESHSAKTAHGKRKRKYEGETCARLSLPGLILFMTREPGKFNTQLGCCPVR